MFLIAIINSHNHWSSPKHNKINWCSGKETLTPSVSEVEMYPGAIEFILMLSFAHSHAKFFANWFMTAKNMRKHSYSWKMHRTNVAQTWDANIKETTCI